VPGERGPCTDFRRFKVANLADQNDVGILAQEGAERGAKFRPICSFICTWLMPANWNSTGSSAVMMLCQRV